VDLVASELAFALAKVQPEATRAIEVTAALRPIRQPFDARILLEATDLVGAATMRPAWDVACAIGAGLAQPACTSLLELLGEDVLVRKLPVPPDPLRMLATRLSADRSPESDQLLRALVANRVLAPAESASARADQGPVAARLAQQLASNPLAALSDLESAADEASYFARLTILEEAMVLLMNQGRLTPFAHGSASSRAPPRIGRIPFVLPSRRGRLRGFKTRASSSVSRSCSCVGPGPRRRRRSRSSCRRGLRVRAPCAS
jgi:hypothetical protein